MRAGALTLIVAGQLALFVGERIFGEGHDLRAATSAIALVVYVAGLAWRTILLEKATREQRSALFTLVAGYAVGAISLAMYGMGVGGAFGDGDGQIIVSVLWPMLWLCGHLPVLFMEVSFGSMIGADRLETRRISASGRAGLVLALAAALFGFVTYVSHERNVSLDARAIKDLAPSGGTLELIAALDEPVTITAFFPPANEVAETIRPYLTELDGQSQYVEVAWADQQLDLPLAEELGVRNNGTIVVHRGEVKQQFTVALDEDDARFQLQTFDFDLQDKLARVVRDQRVAYVVAGHGERGLSTRPGALPGLGNTKERLQKLNYKVKPLGILQGLSQKVPDDADIVFVVGPQTAMLPAEEEALVAYVRAGGSLFLAIDPDVEDGFSMPTLLPALGVTADTNRLAHMTEIVQLTRSKADRYILRSNRFTRHDSLSALSRLRNTLPLVFAHTGSLNKAAAPAEGPQPTVTFTVKSATETWSDTQRNFEFDDGVETRGSFELVAAVELEKAEGAEQAGRAIVTADADLVSDLLKTEGNVTFLEESIRWLERGPPLSRKIDAIDDVPIVHSRDEDRIWFWGTVIGIPLLVLGGGIGGMVFRRRRGQGGG